MPSLNLPKKWTLVKLPKMASLKNGGTPAKAKKEFWDGGNIPFVTAADLTSVYVQEGRSFLTQSGLNSGKTVVCEPGDLLIGTRTRVGNCSIVKSLMGASQDITRVRFKKDVIVDYFYWFFRNISDYLSFYSQGTSIQGITRAMLNDLQIPVPPLAEQRRIVERIEALIQRVDEARLLRQLAIEKASQYLTTAISKVFDKKESLGWEVKKIRQLCEKPQYGFTESATMNPVGPKFLRITDIQNGNVDWKAVPFCHCNDVKKYRLRPGDILFARTGATTGKSFLIKSTPEPAIFASYLIRLQPKEEILPEFLYWYFQSSYYWYSVYSGVEDGNRPNMNGTKLANLNIPFPKNKNEQRYIVDYLNRLKSKVEELLQLQKESEAELDTFTPALLTKAFKGEL